MSVNSCYRMSRKGVRVDKMDAGGRKGRQEGRKTLEIEGRRAGNKYMYVWHAL